MDTLWRKFSFSGHDYATFRPFDPARHQRQSCKAIVASKADLPQPNWLKSENIGTRAEAVSWTSNDRIFTSNGTHDTLAILLCPQALHNEPTVFRTDHQASLTYLPFDEPTFQVFTAKLHIHRALSIVLRGSLPIWSVIPVEVNNLAGEVYILRSQSSLSGRMALSITYIPGNSSNGRGSKMFAYFIGCNPEHARSLYTELEESGETAFSPFTVVKRFLEKERHNRLEEVDIAVSELETILQNSGFQAPDQQSGRRNDGKAGMALKKVTRLYLRVSQLKNGLLAWRAQLEKMLKSCDKFRNMPGGSIDIDPEAYLQRLIEDYDIRISNCATVVEGASLTFQMETFYQASNDTEIAIRDGKAMKTMALVTTFFLPGTFFATLLAVPEFESLKSVTIIPPWSIYLIMFIPLTLILMSYYLLWLRFGSGRPLQRQFGPDD